MILIASCQLTVDNGTTLTGCASAFKTNVPPLMIISIFPIRVFATPVKYGLYDIIYTMNIMFCQVKNRYPNNFYFNGISTELRVPSFPEPVSTNIAFPPSLPILVIGLCKSR